MLMLELKELIISLFITFRLEIVDCVGADETDELIEHELTTAEGGMKEA